MSDQHQFLVDLTLTPDSGSCVVPPEPTPELTAVPRDLDSPLSNRSALDAYPPGVVAEDTSGTVLLVPSHYVVSSRYRSILPFAPDSQRVRRALKVIDQEGYSPLPARWIDGQYEVLGHELLLDALHGSGCGKIRIRPVAPKSEEEAFIMGRRERDKHTPRPTPYELIRDVWRVRMIEGCTTWARVGEVMNYHRSTIDHAQRDGKWITADVVERAGIDETNPRDVAALRRVTGKRLRWVAKGETPDDRAIRLALVCSGEAPDWATPEQIQANQEEAPVSAVRMRKRRDGAIAAVAELTIGPGTTQADVTAHLREYRSLIHSLRSEDRASEQTE